VGYVLGWGKLVGSFLWGRCMGWGTSVVSSPLSASAPQEAEMREDLGNG